MEPAFGGTVSNKNQRGCGVHIGLTLIKFTKNINCDAKIHKWFDRKHHTPQGHITVLATDRWVRVAKRHARQCNQCNGGSKDDTKHKGKCEGKRTIEKVFHVIATRSATFEDRSTTVTHTLGKFIATFSTRLARLDEDPVAQGRRHSRLAAKNGKKGEKEK